MTTVIEQSASGLWTVSHLITLTSEIGTILYPFLGGENLGLID